MGRPKTATIITFLYDLPSITSIALAACSPRRQVEDFINKTLKSGKVGPSPLFGLLPHCGPIPSGPFSVHVRTNGAVSINELYNLTVFLQGGARLRPRGAAQDGPALRGAATVCAHQPEGGARGHKHTQTLSVLL